MKQVPCVLYRHFNKEGRLLYVGISVEAFGRLMKHKEASGWFQEIWFITFEHFASKWEAIDAEVKAIAEERPLHNKAHSKLPKAYPVGCIPLSPREQGVLEMLNDGKTVSQVAGQLCLSMKTVSTYRSRIIEKLRLNSSSTISLVTKAREMGLCGGKRDVGNPSPKPAID